jgi:hypothetical protein
MLFTVALQEQKACTDRVFAFLHHCWEQTGGADAHADPSTFTLRVDPGYARNDQLVPRNEDDEVDESIVRKVIMELDLLMLDEFKKFPGYHQNAQGINVSDGEHLVITDFGSLPFDMQFAIVQGIDGIMQDYRMPDIVASADVDGQPAPEPGCPNCGVYCTCGS